MNEDIKGILIQDGVPTPNNPVRIRKLLVNKEAEEYITNLQNENEKLKETLQTDKLMKAFMVEHNRNEKAIEILHNINDTIPLDLILTDVEHAEYILKDGDE